MLEFQREYNLSKEPLKMDLLVIKKLSDRPVRNEIGRIFKRYNVIEYKSPDDGLSIDDYYKTLGYACLYKGLGEKVGQIPAEELTVSVFRERYPRSLRVLSSRVRKEDAEAFISQADRLTEPGEKNNLEAVLQVSIAANRELYEEIRRGRIVCDALRDLMKDVIEEEVKKGVAEEVAREVAREVAKERQETQQRTLLEIIKNLMSNMKWPAEQAMSALSIPAEEWGRYKAMM